MAGGPCSPRARAFEVEQDGPVHSDPVKAYYAAFGEFEWERLEWADGAIEFEVNTRFLERHLPAEGRILDLGGGPGRYAQWLADRGYRVALADLSPELLEIARRRVSSPLVDEITETDARDLSRWQDATFDAALILGPLYHLPNESDRARAISEVLRVVRSGGIMFFALIPLFGFVRRTVAIPDERRHLLDDAFLKALFDKGAFLNDVPGRFTQGWGVKPQDVAPWFESFGIETVALAASEGLAAGMESVFADLRTSEPAVFDAAMDIVADTATEPGLLGSTNHLLYIGRHP